MKNFNQIADLKAESLQFIDDCLQRSKRPVVYFSGGKDSVVMLHLVRQRHAKIDVIFHREPFPQAHAKYQFGMDVLREWGMSAHDYPPLGVSFWNGKGIIAFTSHYQIGTKDGKQTTLNLPKNILNDRNREGDHDESAQLCGLHDILEKPTCYFNYPWDLAFIGHKDCDEDQIAGKVNLHTDCVKNRPHGPDLAFPLRNWSHDDIWTYTEAIPLPVQRDRYTDRGELKDKTANGDYFAACIKCLDPREPSLVSCPKRKGALVENISAHVPWQDLKLDYFGEQPNVSKP